MPTPLNVAFDHAIPLPWAEFRVAVLPPAATTARAAVVSK